MRSIVSLLRLITSSDQISVSDRDASAICNKLLKMIIINGALSMAGSNFHKNCLLTIGNLMIKIDEIQIDKKYINLLSSLCGHSDLEIRAYSWNILLKVSTTLAGAQYLIKGK